MVDSTGFRSRMPSRLRQSRGSRFDSPASLWAVRTSHLASGKTLSRAARRSSPSELNDTTMLTSLTAYRKSNHRFFIDADLTELPLQANDVRDLQHQVSQELTLVRRTPKLTWIGGAFFFDEHNRRAGLDHAVSPGDPEPAGRDDSPRGRGPSSARPPTRLSDRVSLTGGLRYTDEAKDLANTGGVYRLGTPILADPASFYDFVDRATYDAWTPKVSIQAQAIARHVRLRLRDAGLQERRIQRILAGAGPALSPEFAWSYEGGLKHTMAGGRVRVNTAVFSTDLSGPAGAVVHPPGLARHQQRRIGEHQRRRSRGGGGGGAAYSSPAISRGSTPPTAPISPWGQAV